MIEKKRIRLRNNKRQKHNRYKTFRGDIEAVYRIENLHRYEKFNNSDEHIKGDRFPLGYAHDRYKKYGRYKLTQSEYGKIVRNILRCISYLWVHSTGGVYMKHLGYFTVNQDLKKRPKGFWKDETVNDGVFSLMHYPIVNTRLSGFTVTTPHEDNRIELYKNIVNGKRYFNYSEYIRNLFSKID